MTNSEQRPIRRTERIYYTAQMLFWFSVSLPLALAVLFIQARGLDLLQIGLLLGVYAATVVLLEVPSGGLADAIGRKRVTLLAYAFLLASSVVFLFAFSFSTFLVFYILNGVGRALASGALEAWFIDRLQVAEPGIDLQPHLARAGTFELLALTAGTLFVRDRITNSTDRGVQGLATVARSAAQLSRHNPTLRLLFGATLASGFGLAGIETFWQPRFETLLGDSEGNTLIFGVIMAGSFLIGALGNLISIPLGRLFRKRYGLLSAVFQGLQGLSLVLLALQETAPPAAALFWLVYLTMAVKGSPSMTLFNKEVPSAQRSTMLSVASLVSYAGFFAGSVTLGYVAERAGIPAAWLLAGSVTVMSLVFYLRVDARTSRTPTPPP